MLYLLKTWLWVANNEKPRRGLKTPGLNHNISSVIYSIVKILYEFIRSIFCYFSITTSLWRRQEWYYFIHACLIMIGFHNTCVDQCWKLLFCYHRYHFDGHVICFPVFHVQSSFYSKSGRIYDNPIRMRVCDPSILSLFDEFNSTRQVVESVGYEANKSDGGIIAKIW